MVLMERAGDILARFLDRQLNGPIEPKVGWFLFVAGLASIAASRLPSSEAKIRFDLYVISGEFHIVNSNDNIFLVVGLIFTIIGLIVLYRSVLSPSASRLDAMVKISELLKDVSDSNNAAIQAQFQRAFKYSVEVPVIRKIMLSDNPELTAIDYKIVQSNLRFKDDRFCSDTQPIWSVISEKHLLSIYWVFSIILICSYAAAPHFPSLWWAFWISVPILVVILRIRRKKFSLQRLLNIS